MRSPDRPWGRGDNPATAAAQFLGETDRFVVDSAVEAPSAYHRRSWRVPQMPEGLAGARIPVAGPSITQKEIDYVSDAVATGWYGGAGSMRAGSNAPLPSTWAWRTHSACLRAPRPSTSRSWRSVWGRETK